MAAMAAVVLVSAVAAGVALSGYAMSTKAARHDFEDDAAARYAQLAEDDPAECAACVDDVCGTVLRVNAARADMASPDTLRAAMIADALSALEDQRAATASFLESQDDCSLRRSLASALRGVTRQEAEAAMSALDHVLEADGDLRDAHVEFESPPLTILELVRAIEDARS